jgi:hypothetical protein
VAFEYYVCIHAMVRHWRVYGMKYIEMKFHKSKNKSLLDEYK